MPKSKEAPPKPGDSVSSGLKLEVLLVGTSSQLKPSVDTGGDLVSTSDELVNVQAISRVLVGQGRPLDDDCRTFSLCGGSC